MGSYAIANPGLFVLGGILCLGGFAVYWFTVRLAGVYLGLVGGGGLGLIVSALLDATDYDWLFALAFGLIGAWLGVWLTNKLAKAAFFILGALAGLGLGRILAIHMLPGVAETSLGDRPLNYWIIMFGTAFLTGIVTVFGRNVLLVIFTAALGSLVINASIEPFPPRWFLPLLAALATVWQLEIAHIVRRKRKGRG